MISRRIFFSLQQIYQNKNKRNIWQPFSSHASRVDKFEYLPHNFCDVIVAWLNWTQNYELFKTIIKSRKSSIIFISIIIGWLIVSILMLINYQVWFGNEPILLHCDGHWNVRNCECGQSTTFIVSNAFETHKNQIKWSTVYDFSFNERDAMRCIMNDEYNYDN